MPRSLAVSNVLQEMWNTVRANNGIMMLMKYLTIREPITHADRIRTLACQVCTGLSSIISDIINLNH